MFRRVNKVHFVGIGGIGMSGLALIMKELGFCLIFKFFPYMGAERL